MATTISTFLSKLPSSPLSISRPDLYPLTSSTLPSPPNRKPPRSRSIAISASAAPSGATQKPADGGAKKAPADERVQKVHTIEQFNAALQAAKNKLVVVEFATSESDQSKKIYPFMVQLSRTCGDVEFVLVMGDESDDTRELCRREGVARIPHFSFYKGMEKVHEEEGIGPDELMGDVLYYGDNHSSVVQLHGREDVEALIGRHKEDGRLVVLDVGLKHCGPCVKVYPTVIKLSRSMEDTVVFARMNGDENDSCTESRCGGVAAASALSGACSRRRRLRSSINDSRLKEVTTGAEISVCSDHRSTQGYELRFNFSIVFDQYEGRCQIVAETTQFMG